MSGSVSRSCADHGWVEAMFADLQRQLDDLSGQLQALTQSVHNHTLASLRGDLPNGGGQAAVPPVDGSDG